MTTRFCREALARVELTPARYDLVLFLKENRNELTQMQLRAAFGVARATMSEAVRSLVSLGLVERVRTKDRRTFLVRLTKRGLAIFDHARRMTRRLVKQTLAALFPHGDRLTEMHDSIELSIAIRSVLADTAVRELRRLWHWDD